MQDKNCKLMIVITIFTIKKINFLSDWVGPNFVLFFLPLVQFWKS